MVKKYLCVLSLLLTSCVAVNVPLNYDLNTKPNYGLAVFSVSSNGHIGNYSIFLHGKSYASERVTDELSLWTNDNPLDWSNPYYIGRLVALELPAGNYELWSFYQYAYNYTLRGDFSVPFEVKANKAVYFGDLNILFDRHNSKYTVRIIDNSKRDLPLFFKRYKNISKEDLEILISNTQEPD
ncbi:hypothetical protein KCM76_22330 [Zooshikella marina]|uniref:hypothetical protein n=1 Tax=Zooshikella ganghwensis TaxID=202772 RepID=UPI001BAEBCE0|nr:hypothetical protein [Zooshikella ganghwensis]MBU2708747.1 hypothetical protein [Zooshikella ganghwensis]